MAQERDSEPPGEDGFAQEVGDLGQGPGLAQTKEEDHRRPQRATPGGALPSSGIEGVATVIPSPVSLLRPLAFALMRLEAQTP